MAGEIEEPWVNFQVDSFHCGSISFGRFENEALCWERRSSFSHNRYLEEVEKCSKPGSVTEKKAYFEAHFRKKGLFGLSSSNGQNETDYQTSENDVTDKTANDEETDETNAIRHCARFDESLDGSLHGEDHECRELFGTSISELRFELARDSTNYAEFGSLLSINSKPGIEMKDKLNGETIDLDIAIEPNKVIGQLAENCADEEKFDAAEQGSSAKEKVPSQPECIKPRSINPRVAVGQRKRNTSSNVCKGSENKVNKTVKNVLVRSKAEEKASQTKGVDGINSAEKESRNRTIVEPHSCRSHKVTNRASQSAIRVKQDVGATTNKPATRHDNSSRFSLGRKKEAIAGKIKQQKLGTKSSISGNRLSESSLSANARIDMKARRKTVDPPQVSGGTSCHSTLTSDSSASTRGRPTNDHQPSQAVTGRLISPNKRLEKGNCAIQKGKTFDGMQKTRTGRSTYRVIQK